MARVLLEGNLDHLVTPTHSDARGPVVRGASIEIQKMHWRAGDSARPHQHPEEQAIYVISGRMRMTCGGETYDVGPGEVSYHPRTCCTPPWRSRTPSRSASRTSWRRSTKRRRRSDCLQLSYAWCDASQAGSGTPK